LLQAPSHQALSTVGLSRLPAAVCSLNLVLLFCDDLLPQQVGRLHRKTVPTAVSDHARRGAALLSLVYAHLSPDGLVCEAHLFLYVVSARNGHTPIKVRVAASLPRVLDPLRRNTFLQKLVRHAVKVIGLLALMRYFEHLLAASVPVRLSFNFLGHHAGVQALGTVSGSATLDKQPVLHFEAVFVVKLLAKVGGRRHLACLRDGDVVALGLGLLHHDVLGGATHHARQLRRPASVVLTRREVHLIQLRSAGLDHTRLLPHDLLVGRLAFGAA